MLQGRDKNPGVKEKEEKRGRKKNQVFIQF